MPYGGLMGDILTKVVRVDPINPDPEAIKEAAELILEGKLVAFPTETVYGLGADATNAIAVKRIFEAKLRPADNPVIVHIASFEQLYEVASEIEEKIVELAKVFWPGPFTIIVKKSSHIPNEVSAGLPMVAVRMPAHPVAIALIKTSRRPIAAPSANLSGRPSPTKAEHVLEDLGGRIEMILDAGETLFGVESTIIDLTKRPPRLLRPGPLVVEDIERVAGKIEVSDISRAEIKYDGIAEAPGTKYRHYAPKAPMTLVEGPQESRFKTALSLVNERLKKGVRVGVLTTSENYERYPKGAIVLAAGSSNEPYSIAHNLFSVLREFDRIGVEEIIAEGVEMKGIGFTIMNRLRKAAGHNIVRAE